MHEQGGPGFIVEHQGIDAPAPHNDALRGGVQHIPCRGGGLRHNHGGVGRQSRYGRRAVLAGGIDAVVVAQPGPVRRGDGELRLRQRLVGHGVPLQDLQGCQRVVKERDRLASAGLDCDSLGLRVQRVALRGNSLRDDIRAGCQVGEADLPVLIGGVKVVRRRQALVVNQQGIVGGDNAELGVGQRLARHFVQLPHQQFRSGRVRNGQCLGISRRNRDGIWSSVQHITGDGGNLRHHIGVRLDAVQHNLSVLVCDVNAV